MELQFFGFLPILGLPTPARMGRRIFSRRITNAAMVCFARIKTAFEMNNIQRCDVTLWHVLWLAKLQFAKHNRRCIRSSRRNIRLLHLGCKDAQFFLELTL